MSERQGGRGSASDQLERRNLIADRVVARGSATVEDLANAMGVSVMTIYRDVAALEEAGLVQRNRGTVSALATGLHEASASFRLGQNVPQKRALGEAVARHVSPGMSLMIDDSTSGVWALRAMAGLTPLTVITNSLLVAREVEHSTGVRLLVAGGSYEAWAESLMGSATVGMIHDLRADVAVISASGISEGRCFHPHSDASQIKQAMLASSRTRYLILDHTKFRRRALHAFASLTDFDVVFTDDGIDDGVRQRLDDLGVPLEVVPVRDDA
ncbi:DeoR/GlpR family DNA-binding transcription regulator [Nigerium massiliense]|uniref:DeoR/GlpR family DNA-binding transcription regulator n=1 Tax=Nigerium massiliense TaxID=1522317 RepID=UPI00058B5930|nr:DeoR/GlpR family DNA-binding transcription regulator [Nigerium massiliense]